MKWSSSIRKWSRLIHRDLSFFFAGMVLIYAISGIVMNHRDTINPNFSIERKEYKIAEKLPGKRGNEKGNVLNSAATIGRGRQLYQALFPENGHHESVLERRVQLAGKRPYGRGSLRICHPPPAHRSNGTPALQPRTMVDLLCGYFRSRLIIITLSGVIMLKGSKGIIGRGGIEMIVGIVIPILFLLFF